MPARARHGVGVTQRLAQPIDVELLSGHVLAERDELLDLPCDVRAVVSKSALPGHVCPPARAGARHVEREDGNVVEPLPNLCPFDVGVAGVGDDRDGRFGIVPIGCAPLRSWTATSALTYPQMSGE